MLSAEQPILSVSELNLMAREVLEDCFSQVWVEGEISNLSCPSSGHFYFTLKDSRAQIRCAFFRNKNRLLTFKLQDGQQILARAQVSLYEGRGDFQLIIESLEETGSGQLRKAFEALKEKLKLEGLFDAVHKKPLPLLPKHIGVITSPTGAAIRDILSVLKRRFPSIPILIYPTLVQGSEASMEIAKAIELANTRNECDVLILSRGGGSLEDLWCFNNEALARIIFASSIPIVTGIGHEVDFTIADFVSDHRAPTPSAAAELLSPDQINWLEQYVIYENMLFQKMVQLLQQALQQVEWFTKRLRSPEQRLKEQMQTVDHLEHRLLSFMQYYLSATKQKFKSTIKSLDTVSPLATLHRGYAIVSDTSTDKILYSINEIKKGAEIKARLVDGVLSCKVTEIVPSNS